MRAQAGVHVMEQGEVCRGVEGIALFEQTCGAQQFFDKLVAAFRQFHLAQLFVDRVVALSILGVAREARHQAVDALVEFRAVLGGARNDQRSARFVDKDRVHLVDNGEIQRALKLILQRERHIVAQVIEAELVVGAIDNVGLIGLALVLGTLTGAHHAHAETHKAVQRAHPTGIAAGQVVVYGD